MIMKLIRRLLLGPDEKTQVAAILHLLREHPEGLYGSQLIELSEGVLTHWNAYGLLGHLVQQHLVHEIWEPPAHPGGLSRCRHVLTEFKRAELARQGKPYIPQPTRGR